MIVRFRNNRGFTLAEIIIAVSIMTVVMLILARMVMNSISYMSRSRVQSQLTNDSRSAVNVMVPLLQKAVPNSLVICGCGGAPPCTDTCSTTLPPNPRIQFNTVDSSVSPPAISTYTFFWANNTIQMDADTAGTPPSSIAGRILASNVSELSFGRPKSVTDNSLITITIQMNATAGPGVTETVLLPDILVHMLGS